jgi:hypothetical protein
MAACCCGCAGARSAGRRCGGAPQRRAGEAARSAAASPSAHQAEAYRLRKGRQRAHAGPVPAHPPVASPTYAPALRVQRGGCVPRLRRATACSLRWPQRVECAHRLLVNCRDQPRCAGRARSTASRRAGGACAAGKLHGDVRLLEQEAPAGAASARAAACWSPNLRQPGGAAPGLAPEAAQGGAGRARGGQRGRRHVFAQPVPAAARAAPLLHAADHGTCCVHAGSRGAARADEAHRALLAGHRRRGRRVRHVQLPGQRRGRAPRVRARDQSQRDQLRRHVRRHARRADRLPGPADRDNGRGAAARAAGAAARRGGPHVQGAHARGATNPARQRRAAARVPAPC